MDLKYVQEGTVRTTEVDKTKLLKMKLVRLGIPKSHIRTKIHLSIFQMLVLMRTFVETQILMKGLEFGATLPTKTKERDGNTVTQSCLNSEKKYVKIKTVWTTEAAKTKRLVVEHARLGLINHLISTKIHRLTNQTPVLRGTFVEIQMDQRQFGATLQIQKKDGKAVYQLSQNLDKKNVQDRIVLDTEVAKTKLSMISNVRLGINRNLIQSLTIRMPALKQTIAEIQMDLLQFGAILKMVTIYRDKAVSQSR